MNQVVAKADVKSALRKSPVSGTKKPRKSSAKVKLARQHTLFLVLSILLGLGLCAGAFFLADIRSDWYAELAKPVYCPPLVALYAAYVVSVAGFCTVYALVLTRSKALIIRFEFLFNAVLQLLWTVFFFRIRAIFASVVILALLLVHTLFLLKFSRKQVGGVAFVLLAHLVRIAFSLLLNYSILLLN